MLALYQTSKISHKEGRGILLLLIRLALKPRKSFQSYGSNCSLPKAKVVGGLILVKGCLGPMDLPALIVTKDDAITSSLLLEKCLRQKIPIEL